MQEYFLPDYRNFFFNYFWMPELFIYHPLFGEDIYETGARCAYKYRMTKNKSVTSVPKFGEE